MNIAEITAAAIRLLDDAGWCQGTCTDRDGRVCMGTALWDAAGLPHDRTLTPREIEIWVGISDAVAGAIKEVFPGVEFPVSSAIPKFNDFSSQEDVRLVLETIVERGGS